MRPSRYRARGKRGLGDITDLANFTGDEIMQAVQYVRSNEQEAAAQLTADQQWFQANGSTLSPADRTQYLQALQDETSAVNQLTQIRYQVESATGTSLSGLGALGIAPAVGVVATILAAIGLTAVLFAAIAYWNNSHANIVDAQSRSDAYKRLSGQQLADVLKNAATTSAVPWTAVGIGAAFIGAAIVIAKVV